MNRITVLLVDDHTLVREAFRMMLEIQDEIEVVGEAQNGRQAVEMVKSLHPEVVLMDIGMPFLNGLEATRQVLKAVPGTRVIMLTAHNDDAYVQNAMNSGAVGFLLKQTSAQEVLQGIREVHRGKTFLSASISRRLNRLNLKASRQPGVIHQRVADLSSRELEMLQLIAEGSGNKQAASELKIGLKTVEKHRENLMAKLDIRGIAGLTRFAIRAGIIDSSTEFCSH